MSTQNQSQSQSQSQSQLRDRDDAPIATSPEVSGRPALLGEIAVVALLVFVYDRIRDIASTRSGLAFDNAHQILDVERWLHLDPERMFNLWLRGHDRVGWLSSWYYQSMHLSVTLAVLVFLYLKRSAVYRQARNALVLVNGIGLLVFWLYPVAPPRFLPGYVDTGLVTGVTAHVSEVSANLYAAMPSLHIGWAVWVVLHVWAAEAGRTLKALVVTHLAVTTLIILATANHYLIDALAGVAVATLATALSRTAMPLRPCQPTAVDHAR